MKSVAETERQRWQRVVLTPALKKSPEREVPFTTVSGRQIERLHSPDDLEGLDYRRDLNDPGAFPYTRGIHPTGYRGKLWTMRQFAGFGTPEETNTRYKTLLAAGGTGLSVAFDLPTLMGRDPDHELSLGEVGKCGVSIVSLADMERLDRAPGHRGKRHFSLGRLLQRGSEHVTLPALPLSLRDTFHEPSL
jgi:methylmalonyl-CoA mutase N-terminal domain/subunit